MAIVMLAGCGGGEGTPARSGGETTATSLPPCAGAGKAVQLPDEFPQSFPLPPGTVVTSSRRETAGAVIDGVVPDDLKGAKQFISRELPRAGFKLSGGEAEANEAETDFSGHGVTGRLKVRAIEGCAGAVTLTVGFVRAS
jgi:hypothetical protein